MRNNRKSISEEVVHFFRIIEIDPLKNISLTFDH